MRAFLTPITKHNRLKKLVANSNQQVVLEPNGDCTTNTGDHENQNILVQQPSSLMSHLKTL